MKLAELSQSLCTLFWVMAAIPSSAAADPAVELRDLEGTWGVVTSRTQVGLCESSQVDSRGRIERGRRTTHRGKVRIERGGDGSSWRIKRLEPDGSATVPVRRWTAEVRADGSVVSSRENLAFCSSDPPRWYAIEFQGEIKAKKRLRIELRGTDVSCPGMGCSFKVTHIFTRVRTSEH